MAKKKKTGCGPSVSDGVSFLVVPANKKSLEKIIGEVREDVKYALAELVSLSPQQFAGAKLGERYLIESQEKWNGKYCPYVSIRDTDDLKSPKVIELRKKIAVEEKYLENIKTRTDAASFKSKLAGCANCESKVNRKYIKDSKCPVCGSDLRAPSAAESIKKKEENIKNLQIKLATECIKRSGEAPLRYLVAVPASTKKGENK